MVILFNLTLKTNDQFSHNHFCLIFFFSFGDATTACVLPHHSLPLSLYYPMSFPFHPLHSSSLLNVFSNSIHFILPFLPTSQRKWKKVKSLSHVWLFATPWTVAYQAPPSMGFSRQEYWSCHFLLQGIFPKGPLQNQVNGRKSLRLLLHASTCLRFWGHSSYFLKV